MTMSEPLPAGRRAVVTALGATPLETFAKHLRVEPQPPPARESLAPDDVIVAVKSAAVGWVDLLMASGQYQHVPEPPYTPGLEYAGEVVATGAAVEKLQIGARVMADGLRTGPRSLGEHRRHGGFASYAVAPASALIPLPAELSADEGACLLGGFETAHHALVARGRLRSGETALILGATGSTGLAAVQVAKLLGARVIAVGRSTDKLAVASEVGADHGVRIGEGQPRLRDAVKALTEGRGADLAFDPVGGELSAEALRALGFGGRFVVVGWAATPFVARGDRDPNVLPTNLILMKGLEVLGSPAAIAAHRDPELRRARLLTILDWVRAEGLRPHVSQVYTFDELLDALHAKWEGRYAGNLVLRPRAAP
jgi:NADPH:quinone reductase